MTVQPRRAWRAVVAIARNPDDTAQVFALIEALSGVRTPTRIVRRLRATADGAQLLRMRPDIVERLGDRASLRRLPADSLAQAYLQFVESEGITAEGLRAASAQGESGAATVAPEVEFIRRRMHDVSAWRSYLRQRQEGSSAARSPAGCARRGSPRRTGRRCSRSRSTTCAPGCASGHRPDTHRCAATH